MKLALPLITFFAFLVLTAETASASPCNLTREMCEKWANYDPTINYHFCVAILEPEEDIRCVQTIRRMGWVALRLTRINVSSTAHYTRNLRKNNYSDPFFKACIEDCFQLYDGALAAVREVVRDYKSRVYVDANVRVTSVMDTATTCEDCFTEKEGVVSPLTARNDSVFQLAAIALSILNMLAEQSHL